jgi:hypothetical protein
LSNINRSGQTWNKIRVFNRSLGNDVCSYLKKKN